MSLAGRVSFWGFALAATFLLACSQPPAADTTEADVAAIRAIVDRFDEAMNAGDYEALAELYAEDAIRMPANAPPQIGRDAIREWFRLEMEQSDTQIDNVVRDARVFGDWGYCWGDATGTDTPKAGGDEILIDSKWMSVSRRMPDGSWKVYRDIFNANGPAPSPEG